MALQQAFGFLQPILYDADFIPNPLANSTALDAAADDHAFSNILRDASRALFIDATYTIPPSPIPFAPEFSNEEEPTDSGVVLSFLKFYTGQRRGQSCSYNGFLYSHNWSKADGHSYWECKSRKSYSPAAPFIDYFQKNWLYNRSYPIPMWNCYEATLSDDPRTNNQAEGNNGRQQRAQHHCRATTPSR